MQEGKDETTQNTEATESKPTKRRSSKKTVVAPKQRYFVPELSRTVEANSLSEVAEIVKKEKTK